MKVFVPFGMTCVDRRGLCAQFDLKARKILLIDGYSTLKLPKIPLNLGDRQVADFELKARMIRIYLPRRPCCKHRDNPNQ